MIDRLASLRKLVSKGDPSVSHEMQAEECKIDGFDEFIDDLNNCKTILGVLMANLEKLNAIEKNIRKAVTFKEEQENKDLLKSTNAENYQCIERLKLLLERMKGTIQNAKNPEDPEIRMKKQLLSAFTGKFQDFSKEFQLVQVNVATANSERTVRQALIYDQNLSEEDLAKIKDDPQKVHEIFLQKMNGTSNVFLENFVADIQDKNAELQKLEENVNCVYQLFVDMALLTQQQGELLDNIEIVVKDGQNYVDEGREKLIEAKSEHKKSKKIMCIIAVILAVVLAVVLGTVFGILK